MVGATEEGTFEWLDKLGDVAGKLAEIYGTLVKAGLIKGELPEVPVPYVPEEKPLWKDPWFWGGLATGVGGVAGAYYVIKKKPWKR